MAPGSVGAGGGGGTGGGAGGVASPAHSSQGHRGVQRSISATSNKPRRGSTGGEQTCESLGTTGHDIGVGAGLEGHAHQGAEPDGPTPQVDSQLSGQGVDPG